MNDIVIARGDGIGPEIMDAVLHVLQAAKCPLNIQEVQVGEKMYLQGYPTGMDPKSWDIIRKAKAFLKAPITTPQGGGYKSLNVTIRAALGLYANVRPCISYAPFIQTLHPKMNVVIIRENEEDLYMGIEYRQTQECYHALKMMTYEGSEAIIRYAFEYAKQNNRKKVSCFTKDNILKMTDGMFHKVFEKIATEYPDITAEHWIVDIGAAKLADTPENFDVVVLPNLYGDILSDVAAEIAGSIGLAGSANIGFSHAMFEAIHGSAPRRAGQNVANPSGLLLAAIMMLQHLGLTKEATLIHNAWLTTLEDGIHTYDIYREGSSKKQVGTKEFAMAVSERLGQKPKTLQAIHMADWKPKPHKIKKTKAESKKLVGVDLYIAGTTNPIKDIQKLLKKASEWELIMIANRGQVVFPETITATRLSDVWRCRFMSKQANPHLLIKLYEMCTEAGLEITHTENLYTFDNESGFSKTPGDV